MMRTARMTSFQRKSLPIALTVALLAGSLILSWSGVASPSDLETQTPATQISETSISKTPASAAAPEFVAVSLEDLWAAEGFTIIQDLHGPTVNVLEVCNSVKGYGDYEPNPTHEFKRTLLGRAWLYTEIEGVGLVADDEGKYRIQLSADIIVTDARGRVIYDKDRAYSFEDTFESPTYGVYAYVYVPTIFLGKGDYNVEIMLNDHVGGTQSQMNTLLRIT